MTTKIKNAAQIDAMKTGGKMLAQVLDILTKKTAPGITTEELNQIAERELKKLGGKPAFLGYQGYPKVLCVSINNEIVHGIPSTNRVIKDGDIVSLDFGVVYKGLITDAARSFIVGKAKDKSHLALIKNTKKALDAGIAQVRDGCKVGDISSAIQNSLERDGLSVIRDLVGHGVGEHLHEEPNVPNFGIKNQGPILRSGTTIAIEPMSSIGDFSVKVNEDGWTVVTADGSLSAHFEDTVLVTDSGAVVLTAA